ncbi:helix-turn-helix transcriptional regulator [Pikeienuella sp. HZG-20]|uniref:helix-turn-helix domain-containing protein n=1 Tax=Paludibacillus litoralis TaxID=3133267 RepID=UPI0030EE457C
MAKAPNPIDVHVGSRVKLRRMSLGMSQEHLGRLLGLTFQQIQKYEKGVNRIGASRLFAIGEALDAPIQFFFDEMPDTARADLARMDAGAPRGAAADIRVADFVSTAEGLDLNRSFQRITDQATRRRLADLVRSVAGES